MAADGSRLKILFLEGFYGGSHKEFADGFIGAMPHETVLSSLPSERWKWRLNSSGLYFYQRHKEEISSYDLVFCTSMVNASDFKALCGRNCPPLILYMHENQLTYPRPKGANRDIGLEMINISSCAAADAVVFNSHFHKASFIEAMSHYAEMVPDTPLQRLADEIDRKSEVLYPGMRYPDTSPIIRSGKKIPNIVWNHRWEFDKKPAVFFKALRAVKNRNIPFTLTVLGENSMSRPGDFLKAENEFSAEIVHSGFVKNKDRYHRLLGGGDILVSTSIQENFGISVVEGMHAGLYPLLPERLSYPELIPEDCRPHILYRRFDGLVKRLSALCNGEIRSSGSISITARLSEEADKYKWENSVPAYDTLLQKAAGRG